MSEGMLFQIPVHASDVLKVIQKFGDKSPTPSEIATATEADMGVQTDLSYLFALQHRCVAYYADRHEIGDIHAVGAGVASVAALAVAICPLRIRRGVRESRFNSTAFTRTMQAVRAAWSDGQ
jgi:hypothetical protein